MQETEMSSYQILQLKYKFIIGVFKGLVHFLTELGNVEHH